MKTLKDHLVALNQDQEAITPPCMPGELLLHWLCNDETANKLLVFYECTHV